MNYSETYLLDSEEATHSHPLSPYLLCVHLKGMCQYILFDVGGVEIKEMLKMSKMVVVTFMQHCIHSTVTHLTHVEGVEDVKYYVFCTQWPLAPARREDYMLQYNI